MLFVMRHVDLLVHGEIDRLEVRCGECIPPDIAESSGGSFDERGRIVPSRRSGVPSVSLACQRGNRAIVAGVGAGTGVVDADDDVLRNAALDGRTRARLPATGQGVEERIVDVQELAFAYRKVITISKHEPMAGVERRQRPLTPAHTGCLAETACRSPARGCRCCCRWTWRTCRNRS